MSNAPILLAMAEPATIVFLVGLAISIGLSVAAAVLARKQAGKHNPNEPPPTTVLQGGYVPVVYGVRRVAPLVGAAGLRVGASRRRGSGKSKGPREFSWTECGWHQLCVGPVHELRRIWIDGALVWEGPINRDTTPSGSEIPGAGAFIYWGEENPPAAPIELNEMLYQTTHPMFINGRVGHAFAGAPAHEDMPRWPFLCYVYWRHFDLGAQPIWKQIEYEVGVKLTPGFCIGGMPGAGELCTDPADQWIGGEGANPAHMWWQLALAPFPHGAGACEGMPFEDGDSLYSLMDEPSFCDWAAEAVTDVMPASVFVGAGDTADGALAQILQDHGVLVPWRGDEGCGKFIAQRVRAATPLVVPASAGIGSKLEIETPLLDVPFDKVMYTYQEKTRNYKETVITIDEDGQASLRGVPKGVSTPINTATDYATARKIAERRSQEDLPGNAGYELELNRNAAQLWPGLVLDVTALDPRLPAMRVLEVQTDQLSTNVKVGCVADNYGASVARAEGEGPGGLPTPGAEDVDEDIAATFMELPTILLPTRQPRIVVLRIRDNEHISGANVYLSGDNVTYEFNEDILDAAAGGTLDAGIPEETDWTIPEGPTITIQGPDIGQVLDLSTDLPGWYSGKQLLVIGNEIMSIQKVTAIDADTYRLDGLLRARFGTKRQAHAMGAQVYIVTRAELTVIEDTALILPATPLYVKPQPHMNLLAVPLNDVDPINKTIRGNGIVPDAPTDIFVVGPIVGVPVFTDPDGFSLRWCYISNEVPNTGAGMMPAGNAVGIALPYGQFEARVYRTSDDVLIKEINLDNEWFWAYDYASLSADFAAATPPSGVEAIYIEIRNVNAGFRSEPAIIHLTPA